MQKALEITELNKWYRHKVHALKDLSLSVNKGDFFALLGANGAGKSTTIGIITTLIPKSSGQINVFGYDLDQHRSYIKSMIGVVPQEFNFNQFETVENIIYDQAGYYGLSRRAVRSNVQGLLKKLDLQAKQKTQARRLSGGMKRRLMIARALVNDPELLILDEPTAGVDVELRRSMWDFLIDLNQSGKTIILTTHYLEEAEKLCQHAAIIDQGEVIIQSDMPTLLNQSAQATYLVELSQPMTILPSLPYGTVEKLSPQQLKIHWDSQYDIEQLFMALIQQGVKIKQFQHQAQRLEDVFLHLTKKEDRS